MIRAIFKICIISSVMVVFSCMAYASDASSLASSVSSSSSEGAVGVVSSSGGQRKDNPSNPSGVKPTNSTPPQGVENTADEDLYTVGHIAESVWEKDPLTSKKTALKMARRQAFTTLIHRMLLPIDAATVSGISDDDLQNLVRDVSIDSETFGAQSYSAYITVRFSPELVRKYFSQNDVDFVETRSGPLLIIPVMSDDQSPTLWPSWWVNAWQRNTSEDDPSSLIPFVLSLGNGSDKSHLNGADLVSGTSSQVFSYIGQEYSARNYALVGISQDGGVDVFSVRLYGPDFKGVDMPNDIRLPQTMDHVLDVGVKKVSEQIQNIWKRLNLHSKDVSSYQAVVYANSLQQWLQYKKRLQSITAVQGVEVDDFSIGHIVVNISFRGNENQLRIALLQKNIKPQYDNNNDYWVLNFN